MQNQAAETTAIIDLSEMTSIDPEVLGNHLARELNAAGFELDRLQIFDDTGFRLSGPLHDIEISLEQGKTCRFVIALHDANPAMAAKKMRRARFRLCSILVETLLAAVAAERVAMFHAGVSYTTNQYNEIVVRRDHSARLRRRALPTPKLLGSTQRDVPLGAAGAA